MRLDERGVIVGSWLTIFLGAISTTLTINYYINTRGDSGMPRSLSEAVFMIIGMWLAALLVGMLTGWYGNNASGIVTGLAGYWIGAFVRLIFLKQFLPAANSGWTVFWDALLLRGLPSYHSFLLLVLVGGSMVTILAVLVTNAIKPLFVLWQPSPPPVNGRVIGSIAVLTPILMLLLVILRNLTATEYGNLSLIHTEWLILPQTNMIVAALLGFLAGASYLSNNRISAGVVMFLGLALHVILMMLLEPILAHYDPVNTGMNTNRVNVLSFIFFWIGTPFIGAIAAFALHNLRDAFRMPIEAELTNAK